MYFQVFDATGKRRFKGDNWPMARSALDVVIAEGEKDGKFPLLLIDSESWFAPARGTGPEREETTP